MIVISQFIFHHSSAIYRPLKRNKALIILIIKALNTSECYLSGPTCTLNFKVTYCSGTLPNGEIDFVAEKGGTSVYIQVAYLIADDKTMEREFGNLLKIHDNYPKYVISMNPMSRSQNYEGIKHLTLRQFLMSDNL